jgi:hypothetical protein
MLCFELQVNGAGKIIFGSPAASILTVINSYVRGRSRPGDGPAEHPP